MQKMFITSKCAKKHGERHETKVNNKKSLTTELQGQTHSVKTRNINQQTKYYKIHKNSMNTIKTVMKDNFKVSPSQGFCHTNSATDFYTGGQKFFSIFRLTVAPFYKSVGGCQPAVIQRKT